ncbi:MAG: hypothetical protein LQ338_004824, partial [Usnochroma carphineum]
MSTTLLDPASLAKVEFVVYWIDSFLPGYHEINFLFPNSRDRAIRLVPKADPKCADMKKLAQALVKEVQLFWFNRAITDLITVRRLNARTGWNDGNWWQPIVIHNRRVRAEHEAKTVVERFGDVSRIDQPTKERLASMVNNETIDIVYFESQALPADRQGNRPSIKTLKRNRESRADAAMLEAMAEREQRANLQLASTTTTTTQDETKAEGQSTTTNQELAVNETIVMDTASSTNRESTTLEEAAAPTHDTAATLPESNRPSSEIVGRADTTADE